jgi:hypothetical protein
VLSSLLFAENFRYEVGSSPTRCPDSRLSVELSRRSRAPPYWQATTRHRGWSFLSRRALMREPVVGHLGEGLRNQALGRRAGPD